MSKLVFTCLVLAFAHTAVAASAAARLLSGWRDDGAYTVAIELKLPAGWHTYWRVPGAAGIPLSIDWTGTTNLRHAEIIWPHPEIFTSAGLTTIGYKSTVTLPIVMQPENDGQEIAIDARLEYGICKDICTFTEARLQGAVDVGAAASGDVAQIEAASARAPVPARDAGLVAADCFMAQVEGGTVANAQLSWNGPAVSGLLPIVEADPSAGLWLGVAQARSTSYGLAVEAPVEGPSLQNVGQQDIALRVTLLDATRYIDLSDCSLSRR